MNKQDIKNIIYTVLNSGVDEFTFYCPEEYKNCTKEVKEIANDQVILSSINNLSQTEAYYKPVVIV